MKISGLTNADKLICYMDLWFLRFELQFYAKTSVHHAHKNISLIWIRKLYHMHNSWLFPLSPASISTVTSSVTALENNITKP